MNRLAAVAVTVVFLTILSPGVADAAVPGKSFTETGCEGSSDSIARLYTAGLGREPEQGGFEFWMVEYTSGRWGLLKMATFFTQSPEFQASYGALTQDGFIRQLYRNVLGREGDSGGLAFWNQQMSAGLDRGTVLLNFAESPENIINSGTVQPTLGPFNAGIVGPWTCRGWTPPTPGDTKNCSDFATQAEAQTWFDYYYPSYGDVAKLDLDNNRVPCERPGTPRTASPSWDEAAPVRVVAVQGPTAEEGLYVVVTWDDAVAGASVYEVERDGRVIGSVPVSGERWLGARFLDEAPVRGVHRYRVRGVVGGVAGPWSIAAPVDVRTTADVGPVFMVDAYGGSDLERAEAAVVDAEAAGGGVVLFGARTYVFDGPLQVTGDGVVLRGAGEDRTTIRVGFEGGVESCGGVTPLLLFRGEIESVGAVLAERAPMGSTWLRFDRAPGVAPGDVVIVDAAVEQLPTYDFAARGVAQDPTVPDDARYSFDSGTVVSVDGDRVELDHPLSQHLVPGAELGRYVRGFGNGVELLSVEGAGPEDEGFHRLIDVRDQVGFRLAEVTARWANRNFMDASGHGITLVGFTGAEGGAAGYQPEACKYKVGIGPATDVTVVDGVFGDPAHSRNMSLLTLQFTYRAVIRSSVFGGSTTYGFNEHGGGSRDVVFENNWVSTGPDGWSGILLGNGTWGFSGNTVIRNNAFVDNPVDVLMVENTSDVVIARNRSVGCTDACITWAGWGGGTESERAIDDPSRWGSAQLLIVDNVMQDATAGLRLGTDESAEFSWEGVRDVVVIANTIESDGPALELLGGPDRTGRVWVIDNEFGSPIVGGEPAADRWFAGNDVGLSGPVADLPDWATIYQPWEVPR